MHTVCVHTTCKVCVINQRYPRLGLQPRALDPYSGTTKTQYLKRYVMVITVLYSMDTSNMHTHHRPLMHVWIDNSTLYSFDKCE